MLDTRRRLKKHVIAVYVHPVVPDGRAFSDPTLKQILKEDDSKG